MAAKEQPTTPEQTAAEELVAEPTQVAPAARLITLNRSNLYQVTIADMYPKDSLGYKNEDLRQIFHYTAANAAELKERLVKEFPKYKEFSIRVL